jgi:hypothetical protein
MEPDDPELEAVIRALTGEPEPAPVVVRMPWRDRRVLGTWRRPFPDLLARWQIVIPGMGPAAWGGRVRTGRWLKEWLDLEWAEHFRRYPMGGGRDHPGPGRPVIPWLVHADCNKAHKCPVCGSYAGIDDQLEQAGGRVRYWRVYTCQTDGQRFARRFYLREHPCDRCRWSSHVRSRLRRARWHLRDQAARSRRLVVRLAKAPRGLT